jgi:hypothetical protein
MQLTGSFEKEMGINPERLAVACEELENFKLGTEAFYERRKELAQTLLVESIATTGSHLRGESLEVDLRLRQALIELVFVARHSW